MKTFSYLKNTTWVYAKFFFFEKNVNDGVILGKTSMVKKVLEFL